MGGFERGNKSREKVDSVLNIIPVSGFYDGVHASKREGDEGTGNSILNVVDFVRIGTGKVPCRFVLDGDLMFVREGHEVLYDEWVIGSAMGECGASAEFDVSVLGGIKTWGVGGMSDIQTETNRWHQAMGRHARPGSSDFLLNRIEADE